MRICITRSEKYAYSETFIRDQITEFSKLAKVYTIHSGRYPEKSEDGTLLSPKFFWLIHKVIKTFTGRNNFFSNYGIKKFLKENKIDVVIANYKALLSKTKGEVFNVGFGSNFSINYIAKLISKKIRYTKKRKNDAKETLANIDKIKKKLNWKPSIDVKDGILNLLN